MVRPAIVWSGMAVGALLVTLGGAGCDAGHTTPAVVHRDSAGVVIVESSAARWETGGGWAAEEEPVLDLARTGTGPEHEFYGVRDAITRGDGSIAVANHGTAEVRFFGPEGTFLGSVGREGEGPGEFERLTHLDLLPGDSVAAFDYRQGRLTVIAPELDVARVVSLGTPVLIRELHPVEDGRFVGMVSSLEDVEGRSGLTRLPSPIVTFRSDGAVRDTVTVIPGAESFIFRQVDARPLYGKDSHMAVRGDRIYLATAERMEYRVYSRGELERVVRVPDYDLAVTAAELERERDFRVPQDAPPIYDEIMDAMPDPGTRPAYGDLLVDASGHVWLAGFHAYHERDDPTDWEVFDPDGAWLGSVRMPARFDAFEIGTDYVLGSRTDSLDVEHVQVLRLARR